MNHPRFLPILLTAALVAQSVIGGWGHSHAHLGGTSHGHPPGDVHAHSHPGHSATAHHETLPGHAHEQPGQPQPPTDSDDDCAICRHLALSAILTFDQTPLVNGSVVGVACPVAPPVVSAPAVGLRRPRSPPELS